jgi:hypothetical protein
VHIHLLILGAVVFEKVTLAQSVGRAMAQAVSRRTLSAEVLVRFQVSGIYDGQSGSEIGFSPSYSVSLSISFHRGPIYSYNLG